jgi:hypothetical protein
MERAVRLALERERTAWQQKLERGRARFRQISAVVAAARRAFDKIKVLVDEIESERANVPELDAPHRAPRNQHPVYANVVENRVTSPNGLDQPRKLPSGERRILTALAQYPQGRSKAQVAVLAGYALNGGGFNNYLGSLRSRGFIKGDGVSLTITDVGIEALCSWEPLPTGSALVDYWRGRLGKAERLILETLTQVYPGALTTDRCINR